MHDAISAPYWAAAELGLLHLQQCTECGRRRHYPQHLCPVCHSPKYEWIEASRRATLHSWTMVHHAFDPAFATDVPYTVVIADLEEGPRLAARLPTGGGGMLQIGRPLHLQTGRAPDGTPIWVAVLV